MKKEIKQRINEMMHDNTKNQSIISKHTDKWKTVTLDELVSLRTNKFDPQHNTNKYRCIDLEHINGDKNYIISYADSSESISLKTFFSKDDILFGKLRPYLRKIVLAPFDGVCCSEIWVFHVSEKCNNVFLLHVLRSDEFISLANATTGTKMPRADWGMLKNCLLHIPPLPEQEAIAEVLSTCDRVLSLKHELLSELQKRKKWLMQKLLDPNSGVRLPGFKGKWEQKKLGEIVTLQKGTQVNKETLLSIGKYYVLNGGITPSGYSDQWNTEANTISISEGGNSCGFVFYNKNRFWSGGHCYTLKDIDPQLDNKYLYQFLKSQEELIMNLRVGSGLPNIQKNRLNQFCVNFPSLDEQTAIANVLSTADREIELVEEEIQSWELKKKSLMQLLLTGIVRTV